METERKKRGRPRKVALAIVGGAAVASAAQNPAPTLFDLRLRQLSAMQEELDAIPETILPRNDDFADVRRVCLWYATPEPERVPTTTFEFAALLGWSELKLEIVRSICWKVITRMRNQIVQAIAEYGQLRSAEMMRGLVDAAAAGNTAAFSVAMNVAWGLKPPPVELSVKGRLSLEQLAEQDADRPVRVSRDIDVDVNA